MFDAIIGPDDIDKLVRQIETWIKQSAEVESEYMRIWYMLAAIHGQLQLMNLRTQMLVDLLQEGDDEKITH